MYKKTRTVGAKSFDVVSGCYIDLSNKLCCDYNVKQDHQIFSQVFSFGKFLIVLDEVNKSFVINDNSLVESDFDFRIGVLKYPLIGFYKKEQPRKHGVFDYSTNQVLFETIEWIGRDIIRNYILVCDQGIITCRSIYSAQPLWQFDLENLGEHVSDLGGKFKYEVNKFIGVVGKSLLVLMQQKEILVFNIETGKITQRMKTVDSFLGETTIESATVDKLPFFITNYFLQEDRGVVYALFMDSLYETKKEGDSFKTKVFGLKSEMEKLKINPRKVGRSAFYFENKIYFLDQELGRFGILSVESKTIEYISEVIEIKGGGGGFDKLKEIQASAEKVYVLDKTNTLHIFQKG